MVERKLPDNNEKEQPDFAEEKDVSEVEQNFGLHERRPQRRQEERNGFARWTKNRSYRGGKHAPSSVYYKPNCMRGKCRQPLLWRRLSGKGDVTAVLSLSGPVSGHGSADVVSNLHAEVPIIVLKATA